MLIRYFILILKSIFTWRTYWHQHYLDVKLLYEAVRLVVMMPSTKTSKMAACASPKGAAGWNGSGDATLAYASMWEAHIISWHQCIVEIKASFLKPFQGALTLITTYSSLLRAWLFIWCSKTTTENFPVSAPFKMMTAFCDRLARNEWLNSFASKRKRETTALTHSISSFAEDVQYMLARFSCAPSFTLFSFSYVIPTCSSIHFTSWRRHTHTVTIIVEPLKRSIQWWKKLMWKPWHPLWSGGGN